MLLIRAALDMLKQGCRGRGGLQLQGAQLQKAQGQAAGMEGAQAEQLRKLKLQASSSRSLGALPLLAWIGRGCHVPVAGDCCAVVAMLGTLLVLHCTSRPGLPERQPGMPCNVS